MPWSVHAVPLPDGDRPSDLWVDAAGCLAASPVPGAEPLPGRYVAPGLVDAHAHPAVAPGPAARDGAQTLGELAGWAAAGVTLVRDTGSPGGSVLGLGLRPGMPRLQAAGRFLAPAGRYFPALLPEGVPERRLTDLALAELARGSRWVKVIADFPAVTGGTPSPTYSLEAVEAMTAAVHAAGGRVAAHVTTDAVTRLVRAGVDSVEHGTAVDEPVLAGTDTAGTLVREITLLAEHGLAPAAALEAATTAGYRFLGEPFDQPGRPVTLVTYQDDPREDLAVLSSPRAVLIDGVRVR
jgi:imidazolonepropionase-like amidohydrolase